MEPYSTAGERPQYLLELSLRQSDGPESDPLIIELQTLLLQAIGLFDGSDKIARDEERVPPANPELIAAARKVDSILDHKIGQHAAENAERQRHYRELAKSSKDDQQLYLEVEARIAIVVAVEKLFATGVIALEALATEAAELPQV